MPMTASDLKAMGGKEYRLPIPDFSTLGDGEMTVDDLDDILTRLDEMGRKKNVKIDLFAEVMRNHKPVDVYVLFRQLADEFPHPDRALNIANERVDEAVARVYFDDDVEYVTGIRDQEGGLSRWLCETEVGTDDADGMLVTDIYERMFEISDLGSEQAQTDIIAEMLEQVNHPWILTRWLGRDMAFYVGEYMFLDATAEVEGIRETYLYDAWEVTADAPTVFLDCALPGRALRTELEPHSMINGMKCEYDYEPSDIPDLQESGDWLAQTKYDGARVMVHHAGDGDIRVYMKGGQKDITAVMPEIREIDFPDCAFIFDAEATPYDAETGEVKPFQNILRRIGRHPDEDMDADEMTADLEVRFKFFDCLVWHGEDIRERKYDDRLEIVRCVFDLPQVAATGTDLEAVFHRSLDDGHEGVVMKKRDSVHELGTRSSEWQKWKAQPEDLDVVVTGAHRGSGRISDGIGALSIAVEHNGELVNVGSVGTGFTDKERRDLWREWEAGSLEGSVIQVNFEELQVGSGDDDDLDASWALRFPSYDHKRPDGTVDTLQRAAEVDGKEEEFHDWEATRSPTSV